METYVTFDGDEYCVTLPPKNFCYRIEQLIKRDLLDAEFFPNKKYLVCEKLESECLIYNIGAVNGDSMIEQKIIHEDGTSSYVQAQDEVTKRYRMQMVGFRPCLVPVDTDRRASPLSNTDNPSGIIVTGGRLKLGSKIFNRCNLPNENYVVPERAIFGITDSDIYEENLSWIVIDGLLVCTDILFWSTEYTLRKKNLVSVYACEVSFFRDFGLLI